MHGKLKNRGLYSITEVAEFLNVQVSTIYGWIHKREIPYYKIGRLVKFKGSEIEEWLEKKRMGII